MRSLLVAPLLGTALALAACADPELSITVRYEDPDLRAQLRSLTLAVIELPPHTDGSPVTCDEVRYGRISRDQLDGGRRASASALSGQAGINGVPRLGEKLFVLEGRDAHGDRIAGGCEAKGDIDVDTTVEVVAEVAPGIRVLGQRGLPRDPSAPPTDFDVGLYQPWRGANRVVGVAGSLLQIDLRDRAADRPQIVTAMSCGGVGPACPAGVSAGLATVPLERVLGTLTPTVQPGPVEVTVRAPWAETPLVVRAFEPLTPVPDAAVLLAPAGMGRVHNQAAPSWAFFHEGGVHGAAIFVSGGDVPVYRIVLVENRPNSLALTRREIVANEPIRSLVAWKKNFWTRAASGWRRVNLATATLEPGIGGIDLAATEMTSLDACEDGTDPLGLLIRAGDGPYVAFDGPAQPHVAGPGDNLGPLTAAVNAIAPGRLMATVCLTYPTGGVKRTAVVRGQLRTVQMPDPPVVTYLIRAGVATTQLPSPIASGFFGYRVDPNDANDRWRLAGATLDVTGPRLASFTLTTDQLFGGDDGRLAGDLTTLPTSTTVADLDGNKVLDVVATGHEIVDESRIQVTYLATDDRPALTGLSPVFQGVAPRVSLERIDVIGHYVATVATSDVVATFDLGAM